MTPKTKEPKVVLVDPYRGGIPGLGLGYLAAYLREKNTRCYSKINFEKFNPSTDSMLVDIYAYCLMPNHFHLLLLQLAEQPTITDLLKRVSITYAMYFQEKHQHAGVLFQGKYKSVPVKSGNQLLYLSKYIHLNPAKIVGTEPTKYLYSSLPAYINEPLASKWLYPEIILENFFPNSPNKAKKYLEFIMDRTDQDLEIITPVAIEL